MKSFSGIFKLFFLISIIILCVNFSNGGEKDKVSMPEFVSLIEGEGLFAGNIYDEKNIIPVKEISFTGHTKIGGIRRESDDSINVLDFSKIKGLEILNETYISPRYQDKEYILAKITSNTGATINDLLIPRNVVICAIATETEMEKSWYLRKIKKITIEKDLRRARAKAFEEAVIIEEEKKEPDGTFLGKVKSGFKSAADALNIE